MTSEHEKRPKRPEKGCKTTSMNTTDHPAERVAGKDADGVGSKKNLLKTPPRELRFKAPERGAGSSLSDEQYNALCLDLVAGKSIVATCTDHEVAKSTAQAIRESIRDQIPSWKERTSAKLGGIISELADSIQDDLRSGKLSADKKPVAFGILIDKKFALDGDNVSVIRHEKGDSGANFAENFNKYLESLPTANGDQLIIDQVDEAPKPLNINDPVKKRVENEPNGGGGDS
jgi:hypothetical protein